MRCASGPTRMRASLASTPRQMPSAAFAGGGAREPLERRRQGRGVDGLAAHVFVVSTVRDDAGLHAAGADHRDPHAGAHELLRQRLAEAANREFARVVGRLARHADEAKDARHVDDVRLVAAAELRQERLGAAHHTPKVDVHEPREVVALHLPDRVGERHPGVVHDHVRVAELLFDLRREREDLLVAADVDLARESARRGEAPVSASVSSRPSAFQSASASDAPRLAAPMASARPIPEPAPVMTTTLSSRVFMASCLVLCRAPQGRVFSGDVGAAPLNH